MADVVSREVRSRMMAGIRGKNTRPELLVRSGLFALGYRFRLHDHRLPGRPDLVFRKHHAVIFVHGCFWHRHRCPLFKWPTSNVEFWRKKISGNAKVDRRASAALTQAGWRILTIWECAIKRARPDELRKIIARAAGWLESRSRSLEIAGKVAKRRGR